MSSSAIALLREHVLERRVVRILVPFLTLVAVLAGLLALHSLGSTAHSHPTDTAASSSASHDHAAAPHDHAATTDHHVTTSAGAALSIGPEAPSSPACPEGTGLNCCAAASACAMVLALLSVSIAIGGSPATVIGAAMLLAVVVAFTVRLAPVEPPSLAQLSTFRI